MSVRETESASSRETSFSKKLWFSYGQKEVKAKRCPHVPRGRYCSQPQLATTQTAPERGNRGSGGGGGGRPTRTLSHVKDKRNLLNRWYHLFVSFLPLSFSAELSKNGAIVTGFSSGIFVCMIQETTEELLSKERKEVISLLTPESFLTLRTLSYLCFPLPFL